MNRAVAIGLFLLVVTGSLAPPVAAGSTAVETPEDAAVTRAQASTGSDRPATTVAATTNDSAQSAPPDPETDVLGWESVEGEGIWYNESIPVNNADGLTERELNMLVARTMARVEYVRRLEFETTVDVSIRSREAYRANVTSAYANVSQPDRIHQNVKYEATFLIGEDRDAIDQLASNRASSVLGFYSPSTDEIVVIADGSTLQMDEFTLSHELAHAVQDQHFDLSQPEYRAHTEDANNAVNGIIEGDAHYTEKLYARKCNRADGAWNGTCIRPVNQSGGGGGGDFNVGVYLIGYQPYSDGPPFVDGIRQEGGWDGVNAVYENPPASAEQVIHPEKYPGDEPTNVTVEDRSAGNWTILDLPNGSIDYATFGEAGLFAMFWYPSYREQGTEVIVPYQHLFDVPDGSYDTYNYEFQASAGWDGDKLYPYVPTDADERSPEATGYVWKLAWDTDRDAEEFVGAYRELLRYYGADAVEGRQSTYRIAAAESFDDAYYVEREGSTVWIVNAPSVAELSAIRSGAAPEGTAEPLDPGPLGPLGTPGFGPVVALVALLVGALLATRRIRE